MPSASAYSQAQQPLNIPLDIHDEADAPPPMSATAATAEEKKEARELEERQAREIHAEIARQRKMEKEKRLQVGLMFWIRIKDRVWFKVNSLACCCGSGLG